MTKISDITLNDYIISFHLKNPSPANKTASKLYQQTFQENA